MYKAHLFNYLCVFYSFINTLWLRWTNKFSLAKISIFAIFLLAFTNGAVLEFFLFQFKKWSSKTFARDYESVDEKNLSLAMFWKTTKKLIQEIKN